MSLELPESRSFHMGFSGTFGGPLEVHEQVDKTMAEHAEMVVLIFHDLVDVPWPEALAEKPYPRELEEKIAFRKSHLPKGQKVYVMAGPLTLGRNALKERPDDWKDKDFDDPDVIAAFTNHCRRLIREFKPDYFCYGVEVNTLATSNPTGFRKYLVMAKEVYEALKKENPNLPIFLSFTIDHYYKDEENQREAVRQLLPYTDYIAVSTYPYMSGFANPEDFPQDWFSRIAELDPTKPFAIGETSYPAEDLVLPERNVNVPGSEAWQAWYARFILEESNRLNGRFVAWFFARDYDAYFEQLDEEDSFTKLLRIWRDTGMLDGDGNARESLHIWDEWLKLPRRALPRL